MAVIYREITGTVIGPSGDPLAAGTLKVKPRGPIVQGASFIAPSAASVEVVDGEFDLTLAAPSLYEFTVISDVGETLWDFQSPLTNETSQPISLAELFTNRNDEVTPDDPYEVIRVSGDTYAIRLWLVDPDTGGPLDLNTALTVVLTVDEREEPDDLTTRLFQLVGEVIDPDKGVVDFAINEAQALHVGNFFFDVEVTYPPETVTITFEEIAPVGQLCPIRSDLPLMGARESGSDQEFYGAMRDGAYVLKQTVSGGAFQDTWWNTEPASLFASGVIEVFARGYLKNAQFGVSWLTHHQFFASLLYVGDDALLSHYNHNSGSDPQDYIVFYEPQVGLAEGWWNIRFQIDLNNNTIKNRHWGGDFSSEPLTWVREYVATDFREDVIAHGSMGWLQTGMGPTDAGDFIAELAYFGYTVSP